MELVCKEHYSTFYKHLLVCDMALGPNFFKEIQVHYNMNLKLEMLIEKPQNVGILLFDSIVETLLAQAME